MISLASLSYFTKPLKIWLAISELEESVAKIGLIREGFEEVLRCSVDATRDKETMKRDKRDFKSLLFKNDYNTLPKMAVVRERSIDFDH